ncbi:hypothetical protein K457DRAFT_486454 [Linnemannia elongata AG-77]|uniref:RNase L inhibitor RLI-like possible metal-binding domain-containing protein n=1 Tax=Linnemannia elongata AG-77 TaxID=1314771 RepID=A0A197JWT7_9FUNG|nr:hypothetical protein K457DRAFT_486454 [Linnemannia elongata AG-77]
MSELTRIAIVSTDKCKPKKCRQECKKSCPVVKMGKDSYQIHTRRIWTQLTLSRSLSQHSSHQQQYTHSSWKKKKTNNVCANRLFANDYRSNRSNHPSTNNRRQRVLFLPYKKGTGRVEEIWQCEQTVNSNTPSLPSIV